MSSSHETDKSIDSDKSSSPKRPEWAQDSLTPQFVIEAEDIAHSASSGKEWANDIDSDIWTTEDYALVMFSPAKKDSIKNSESSNDENILHQDPEVVKEFTDKYGKLSGDPLQEGDVVINQGMSFKDILTHLGVLEAPVKATSGSWENMVFSAENPKNSDQVVLNSNEDRTTFVPSIIPAGNYDEAILEPDSGELNFEYVDNPQRYTEDHNLNLNALEDLAVGRGLKTPGNIRYGELLVSNSIEFDPNKLDPQDLWDADIYVFELEDFEESKYQVQGNWTVDLYFEDEVVEDAIKYTENSLYVDGFHEMNSLDL